MRPGLQHRLHTTARIDWFAVLVDLQRRGLSGRAVSEQVVVPYSTLSGWKQGSEPNHADGERLIALWMRMTDRPRADVPMTHCPEWLTPLK